MFQGLVLFQYIKLIPIKILKVFLQHYHILQP